MKPIIASIIISLGLVGAAIIMTSDVPQNTEVPAGENVSIIDGVQIIEITAKGGYSPRKSVAKAGIPTVLRFNTKGTFDCSSAVIIPSLNIGTNLPSSGVTDIELQNPVAGILNGSCGMGMYPFEVEFE